MRDLVLAVDLGGIRMRAAIVDEDAQAVWDRLVGVVATGDGAGLVGAAAWRAATGSSDASQLQP